MTKKPFKWLGGDVFIPKLQKQLNNGAIYEKSEFPKWFLDDYAHLIVNVSTKVNDSEVGQ